MKASGINNTTKKRKLWTLDPSKDLRRLTKRLMRQTGIPNRTCLIERALVHYAKNKGCISKGDLVLAEKHLSNFGG